MNQTLNRLYMKMIEYYQNDPHQIQHFVKVHSFAKLIAESEGMDKHELFILESAAYVHDIGIKPALRLYNSSMGKYQEELGPAEAEPILLELGYEKEDVERICYLIAHHHTYDHIEGMDYQILVEADFLVNFHEDKTPKENICKTYDTIFKTDAGMHIAEEMYGLMCISANPGHSSRRL